MLFIVDIDFTCANAAERMKAAGQEPGRWDQAAYDTWLGKLQSHETMMADKPYIEMRNLLVSLVCCADTIIYLTGRSERWRETTKEWLKLHDFPCGEALIMRSEDDYRSAGDYKAEALKYIIQIYGKPAIAIDDDSNNDTSERYKAAGVFHLKAMG